MIHSITFGNGQNTYDDYGMMAVERLVFASPSVKTNFVEITGSDNSLDLSEVLTGYPTYEDRKGSFKFRFIDNGEPVRDRLTRLMNAVHGKRLTAILSEEPDYYYDVRWSVNDPDYKRVGEFADVELQYIAKAYKYEVAERSQHFTLTFNYISDGEYNEEVVKVHGTPKPSCPKVTIHSKTYTPTAMRPYEFLVFDEVEYSLYPQESSDYPHSVLIPQIILLDNEYEFKFIMRTKYTSTPVQTITMDVSIDFQGGYL